MQQEKKKLNVFDLTSIGIGSIIGAGLFSMLGTGIYYGGRGVTIAVALAMLMVFLQHIRKPILAGVFVLPGGNYDQNSLTLPAYFTGANALMSIISNLSLSVFGISMASYIATLIPALADYQKLVAVVMITLFFGVSIPGTKFLSMVQNLIVVLMYVALAIFVIFGIINLDASVMQESFLPQGITGLLMSIAMMSFTCSGATTIINLTAETKNPKKNIPLSMVVTTVVCIVIYALLGFAATCALPYADVANQNMGDIAQHFMPNGLYLFFVIGGALTAIASSLLGTISGMKWPILGAAKDGWLPKVFTKETKNGFPWVVMLTMYLIAVVPIIAGFSLQTIVSFILVPSSIITIAANFINWKLPEQFPKAWSENSWHLSPNAFRVLMVLATISGLILTIFTLSTNSVSSIIGNLIMTVFVFAFGYFRFKSGKVHLSARELYKE